MSLEDSLREFIQDTLYDEFNDVKKDIFDDVSSHCDDIIESKLEDIDFVDTDNFEKYSSILNERLNSFQMKIELLQEEKDNLEKKYIEFINSQNEFTSITIIFINILVISVISNVTFSIYTFWNG